MSTGRIELSLRTALSATSHGLGMTLGMTLIYPVQCRVVARRTRCACPMFCDDAGLSRDTGKYMLGIFAGAEKDPRNEKTPRKSGDFPRNAKKNVRSITPLKAPPFAVVEKTRAETRSLAPLCNAIHGIPVYGVARRTNCYVLLGLAARRCS